MPRLQGIVGEPLLGRMDWFIFFDPPDVGKCRLTQPPSALRVSAYILPTPSLVGRRLHKFRLRLTTASVCGAIDYSLRLANVLSRHRSYITVSGAFT